MLKIAFLGSDPIALPLLEWLGGDASGARVVGVFTQPDRPVGRGRQVQPSAIKLWAQARGLPVLQPARLGPAEREQLAALGADVALVMAYGHILRQEFIDTPRLGTLNLHTSVLPKFRGASPIQSAIAAGETETGVTLMRIVLELDAGPVAAVERVPIGVLDTAADVEARLAQASVPLVARCLPELAAGRLRFAAQDPAAATFCRRLDKADGVLDFSAPAATLARRVNGLFPWPACSAEIGALPVKLGLADATEVAAGPPPGTVLGADAHGLLVATGQGALRLRRLQRPGGRMLEAADFLRGHPVPAGAVLPSRAMPPLVTRR